MERLCARLPELVPAARPALIHGDLNYTYDDTGNITRIADLTPAPDDDTQCFGYDHLRRLTEAWRPRSGDCAAAQSVPALGGPAPYWQSWEFDPVGNRRTQVDHGQGETSRTYTYPAAKSHQPHTLSTVVTTGAATATHDYAYDVSGNTTCRPVLARTTVSRAPAANG